MTPPANTPAAGEWKLVPVEPTEEMLAAPLGMSPHHLPPEMYESRRDLRPLIYKAMLAAAPQPVVSHEIQSVPAVSHETENLRDKTQSDRQTPPESVRAAAVSDEMVKAALAVWFAHNYHSDYDPLFDEEMRKSIAAALAASSPAPDTAEVAALRAGFSQLGMDDWSLETYRLRAERAEEKRKTAETRATAAETEVTSLRAEVERLRAERDDYKDTAAAAHTFHQLAQRDADARATAAEERADKLAGVLRPFADLCDEEHHNLCGLDGPYVGTTEGRRFTASTDVALAPMLMKVGLFRRARAALTQHDQARKTGEDSPMTDCPVFPGPPQGWRATSTISGMRYDQGTRCVLVRFDSDVKRMTFYSAGTGTWLPGVFADLPTAIAAFELDNPAISLLQRRANVRGDCLVTAGDLAEFRKTGETDTRQDAGGASE